MKTNIPFLTLSFLNISHSIVLPSTPTLRSRIYSGAIPFNSHACYILRTLKHLWFHRPNNTATLPDRATCSHFKFYTGHLDFRTEATDLLPQSPPNGQTGTARNMQLLFIQKTCNFKLALHQIELFGAENVKQNVQYVA